MYGYVHVHVCRSSKFITIVSFESSHTKKIVDDKNI